MLDYLREQAGFIDRELEGLLPRQIDDEWVTRVLGRSTYEVDTATLTKALAEPIWDFMDRGGKRWRPVLMLLCAEAVCGSREPAVPLIPLIEFIHNGTLVHDDLEDDSALRRGRPCVHKLFGVDIATNVGSAMYFLPFSLLYAGGTAFSDGQRLRIYDMVAQELMRCHCGQGLDIAWHKGLRNDISESEYLQMCAYKTGVLARLSARVGALVANATEAQIEGLGRFGETLGVGFQIQDDILNLVGDEFAKGKGRGEDIHEGKRTLLVLHALERASVEDAARLREILASHPEDQQTIDEAIGIIEQTGAIDYARAKARELATSSWQEIDRLLDPSPAKGKLHGFAEFLISRSI